MENEDLINALLDELKTLNQNQKEISQTLKILARSEIERRLTHIFSNEFELLIYQLSNGENPTTEIAKHVPLSTQTISKLWQKWEEQEIVETEGYRNPYRAKYSLEQLALIFGKPTKTDVTQAEEKE